MVDRLQHVDQKNNELLNIIKELKEFKDQIIKDQELKEQLRFKRKNRKQLEKKNPLTEQDYKQFIQFIDYHSELSPIIKTRLILMSTILIITGLRFSEALNCKIGHILSLYKNNFLIINRLKRGRGNKRAYLSKKGKEFLSSQRYNFILYSQYCLGEHFNSKNVENKYLFSTPKKKGNSHISVEHVMREMNKMLKELAQSQKKGYNYSTHSFRVGFINNLWRISGDI